MVWTDKEEVGLSTHMCLTLLAIEMYKRIDMFLRYCVWNVQGYVFHLGLWFSCEYPKVSTKRKNKGRTKKPIAGFTGIKIEEHKKKQR